MKTLKKKWCDVGSHECDTLFHSRTKERLSSCFFHAPKNPIKKRSRIECFKEIKTSDVPVIHSEFEKPIKYTPRKPINKVSDKEKKRQIAYSILKKEYMKHHSECEVKLPGCRNKAIDIHHLYFGADRYGHFLDFTSWKSTCRSCHNKIHDELSGDQLIELGLRLKE